MLSKILKKAVLQSSVAGWVTPGVETCYYGQASRTEPEPTRHTQSQLHADVTAERQCFDVLNPSTGVVIGAVPDMTSREAHDAVHRAAKAFPAWRNRTAKERSDALKSWHELILKNADLLATLITTEMGKPLRDSRAELAYGSGFVEWYAEEAKRTYGDVIPSASANKRVVVVKEPVGVAAMITPWNFPLAMVTRKAAPALASGCTVVLKAAEDAPITALALKELATEAGIPDDVFNVLTCSRDHAPEVGKALCEHPLVAHLSFTGSTQTGKILLEQAASTVKKVSLELGGNAPFIVFKSADIDLAVDCVLTAKFRCSGQTCVCVNRILVQDDVHDEFVNKLAAAMNERLIVGDGLTDGVTQGPLVNYNALLKVESLVTGAVHEGATVMAGGQRHQRGGLFFEPTLLTDVTQDMTISSAEIFGPVATVQKFFTEDDVLQTANDTNYGLASYVFTRDVSQCWRVAEKLEYGMVGVNEGLLPAVEVPMGGVKQSGLGREGSKYGIDEFMEMKYMCFGHVC